MKLVTAFHVSNVLGTINPVDELVARARAAGAASLLDGSQAVPQMPVDVGAIGADFYVWTAHKAYGPTGIGVLHGRREVLEAMPPFLGGGDMISSVDFHESRWNELPWKFEAGTSPIAEAVGLGAAVEFLQALGMDQVRAHERELTAYALDRLEAVEGLTRLSARATPTARGALVSFVVDGVHPHDVAEILARQGVCVRAGHHCAQPLMRTLGVPATTRASFAVHNSAEDVDRLVGALGEVQRIFALMDDLYREEILSTTSGPTTGGRWSDPDLEFEDSNPLCGDELHVMLRVGEDGTVRGRPLRGSRLRDQPGRRVHGLRRGQGHVGRRPDPAGPPLRPGPARHRHLRDAHEVRPAEPEGPEVRGPR